MAHGVHHRVPVAAEVGSDLRHGSAVMADLVRRPPTRTIRHPATVSSNPTVGLDERNDRALRVRATPTLLRPDQPGPPTEARQVDEFDLDTAMSPHLPRAARTHLPRCSQGDRDAQPSGPVTDSSTLTSGKPTSSSHMRVGLVSNRGSSSSGCVRHTQIRRAPARARGPRPTSPHAQIRRTRHPEGCGYAISDAYLAFPQRCQFTNNRTDISEVGS